MLTPWPPEPAETDTGTPWLVMQCAYASGPRVPFDEAAWLGALEGAVVAPRLATDGCFDPPQPAANTARLATPALSTTLRTIRRLTQ
jgi:hypothetical protein